MRPHPEKEFLASWPRLAYSVVDGARLTLEHHHASFEVRPERDEAGRLIWTTNVLPHTRAAEIRIRVEHGAREMKQAIEAAARASHLPMGARRQLAEIDPCVSTASTSYAGRSAACRPLEDFVQPDRADVARRTAREDLLQTVAMAWGGDTRAELLSTLKWVARPGTAGRATARRPKPGTAPPR